MKNNICAVPEKYKKAVSTEQRGTISDVTYSVKHYINQSRQLVVSQNNTFQEIGRETVTGNEIRKKCIVYLPADYNKKDKSKKYNVLYLLHGVGGNRNEWLTGNKNHDDENIICNIFDNLIANKEVDPFIVVFTEGRSTYDWTDESFNMMGTNILGFYYFDYEMRYDLIPFIESEYNTYANVNDRSEEGIAYNRLHRAIAGLSMGGMQCLNLGVGGYRCDSVVYTKGVSAWKNGLETTVTAPGMIDLFAYVGAFSNAPSSSDGKRLGSSIKACNHKLSLLYMTCGDADEIAYQMGYRNAVGGLAEAAGDNLGEYYRVVIEGGVHDMQVWNNGAYNFSRLCFKDCSEKLLTCDIWI